MKKLMTALAALMIVALGLVVPQAANAATHSSSSEVVRSQPFTQVAKSAELAAAAISMVPMTTQTGEYEYICIGTDGSSWSLASGEPTTDCHGSYLHKYINGVMVANYHLAYGGGAAQNPPGNIGCVLAIAGTVSLFYFPPTGVAAWVVNGGLAAAGLFVSCTA